MSDRWFTCVPGIVVSTADPEGRHRIQCLIPDISEEIVHAEWIEPLMPWVGTDGYGPSHLPAVESEVLLFGMKGEKYTLFYLSRYNENFRPPAEFADRSRGCKCDTVYKLLGDLLILIRSLQRVDVEAPSVRLLSNGAEMFRVEGDAAGFRGAAIARRALPADAINLATNNELTNAIKQLLIDLKLAQ